MSESLIDKFNRLCEDFTGLKPSSGFYSDWNSIMYVIEKIESIDDSSFHYEWRDESRFINNFIGYSVSIETHCVLISTDLELDPDITISLSTIHGDIDKKEATARAIIEFLEWRKNLVDQWNKVEEESEYDEDDYEEEEYE